MTAATGLVPGRGPEFSVRVEGDRRLPPGGGDVHAVVRVTRIPPAPAAGPAPAAEVALRLWTPRGAWVAALVQIAPGVCDLTDRRTPCGPRTGGYPAGSWADESRAYHLHLRVPSAQPGRRMRAARLRVLTAGADPQVAVCGDVLAEWIDEDRPADLDPATAGAYDGSSCAVQEGLRTHPDDDTATVRLGRAVAPARARYGAAAAGPFDTAAGAAETALGTVRLRALDGSAEAPPETCTTTTERTRAGDRGSGAV